MLRFLNLGKFIRTESVIIRQPSVLATRDFSGSSWLEQAKKRSDKNSKGTKGSKGTRGTDKSGSRGSKGSSSSSSSCGAGKGFFGSKMSPSLSGTGNSVCNDKISHRFTLDLGNNQKAHIDYKSIGRNKIELYYTEVPNELRGRGIGRALARGALEQAAKNNMKVKLSCTYLRNNLDKFADAKLKKVLVD